MSVKPLQFSYFKKKALKVGQDYKKPNCLMATYCSREGSSKMPFLALEIRKNHILFKYDYVVRVGALGCPVSSQTFGTL